MRFARDDKHSGWFDLAVSASSQRSADVANYEDHPRSQGCYVAVALLEGGDSGVVGTRYRVQRFSLLDLVVDYRG